MQEQKKEKSEQSENTWPVMDEPERARESAQIHLVSSMLKRMGLLTENRVTPKLVRAFLQVCEIAVMIERIIYEDSTSMDSDVFRIPEATPNELVLELLSPVKQMRSVDRIPGMEDTIRIAREMEKYEVKGITDDLIVNLDQTCEAVFASKETEARCIEQLEVTEDAIQRAMIYLEMGKEEEAYREFQKISSEELHNPDNALDLVDLTERFQDKPAALRVLKRWFILGIVLHPLTFDLIADMLFPGLLVSQSVRVDHLRKLLTRCEIDSVETIRRNMTLVMPARTNSMPDLNEIEDRLKILGTSLHELNLTFEDTEEVCIYTLLTEICTQLNRLAVLARETNNLKLALNAIERCVLSSLVLFFLPQRIQDIHNVPGYGSYNICHEWLVQNLQESYTIFKSIRARNHSEKLIAARLSFSFDSIRTLAEKIVKKQTIEAESQM